MDHYTFFQKLAMPAFLFTLFFTFCRHNNPAGILLIPGCIALCIYLCYSVKTINLFKIKKGSIIFLVFIMLFGISCFLTGFKAFWFFSHTGILVSAVAFLIYNAYDSKRWSFGQQLFGLCKLIGLTIVEVPSPIIGLATASKVGKAKKLLQVFIALAIALPLILIIVGLLVSADAIFGSLVDGVFGKFSLGNIISFSFMAVFVFFMSYCTIKALGNADNNGTYEKTTSLLDPFVGTIITGLISIIYLVFSNVQIFGLFLGKMSLPENMTYAEYAKKGFFQLMFVCFINLLIVLICKSIFRKNILLNTFLLIICASTGIMLASSAFKMYMYTAVYGLTRLRFTTFAGQITIAVLLLGITINVLFPDFGLYRFGLITILCGYMLLSLSHMDYWIVKYNVTRNGYDEYYISKLSTDAVPALVEHGDIELLTSYYKYHERNFYERKNDFIYDEYYDEYYDNVYSKYTYGDEVSAYKDTFKTFNLSHYMYMR